MIRAKQNTVAQTTNVNIIQIRSLEINYFCTFYLNFGTQSALVTTMVYTNFALVQIFTCNPFWLWMFWVNSALCVVFSIKALSAALYISVYGEGLALRGPTGSMVKAIEGMIIEQNTIITDFSLSILFLALSTIGIYFVTMGVGAAITCSIITVLVAYLWYNNTCRVYNRFKFEKESNMTFNNEERFSGILKEIRPPSPQKSKVSIKESSQKESNNKNIFSRLRSWIKPSNQSKNSLNKDIDLPEKNELLMTGYLTMKIRNEKSVLTRYLKRQGKYIYKRRYVVLYNTYIFVYKSKLQYETNPDLPIRKRPIDMSDYKLLIPTNNEVNDDNEPNYVIYLIPKIESDGINLEFRCDTLNESLQWIEILMKSIQLCDDNNDKS